MSRVGIAAVRIGSGLALAGFVHGLLNARLLRVPGPRSGSLSRVAVLVPARNEAATIGDCVSSIERDVLVLDDESVDGTAVAAVDAGAQVLNGVPAPPGWLGKPWACAQLAAAADPHADVLVFVDADVRLAPGAVDAAVTLLADTGLDVLCPFPRQVAESLAERLIQPLLQWSWLTLLPLRVAERSTRPSLTAACGQFVLIRRAALERAGGFAAVRGEVLDDVALVRAVKSSGGRGGVVDGTHLATCRMYRGWADLRDGYGKSLWSAFGPVPAAAAVLALLGLAYVAPPIAAVGGSRIGAIGYSAAVASRVVAARRTGGRALPDALAHPASIGALGWLTIRSHVAHRRGLLQWKGRVVEWG